MEYRYLSLTISTNNGENPPPKLKSEGGGRKA